MFLYLYLSGLLIGLGVYAITYLFAKEIELETRVIVVIIVGSLTIVTSIIVIGGFEGMPFGMLGLGILTFAILLGCFSLIKNRSK